MRILFTSSEYPPQTGRGGIGTYTRVSAQALAARGHHVEVIALSETGKPYDHLDGSVPIHRAGPGRYPLPEAPWFYQARRISRALFPESLVRLAWARSAADKYAELASRNAYDVVEAAECGAEAFYLRPRGKTKLIIRLHTPWAMAAALDKIDQGYWDLRLTGWLEKSTARRAHAVTSPTDDLGRRLKRQWGLKAVTCYPNPLDTGTLGPKTGEGDYIIYTGRVEFRKGVHLLIGALARLQGRGLRVPLKIIGAPFGSVKGIGPYEDHISSMIKTHGLSGQIDWVKGAPRTRVIEALQGAKAAVYPSLWENFPYTCLEAMAVGLPVVASRCGGYPEMIVHGETGLLADPGSETALADGLSRLVSDAPLRERLGGKARAKVLSEFSSEKIAARAEAFYTQVIHG